MFLLLPDTAWFVQFHAPCRRHGLWVALLTFSLDSVKRTPITPACTECCCSSRSCPPSAPMPPPPTVALAIDTKICNVDGWMLHWMILRTKDRCLKFYANDTPPAVSLQFSPILSKSLLQLMYRLLVSIRSSRSIFSSVTITVFCTSFRVFFCWILVPKRYLLWTEDAPL